jgi:hypothetical protein
LRDEGLKRQQAEEAALRETLEKSRQVGTKRPTEESANNINFLLQKLNLCCSH